MRRYSRSILAALAAALVVPATAQAVHLPYEADLDPLNGSGVEGTVTLRYLTDAGDPVNIVDGTAETPAQLRVQIDASGLEPNQVVPAHIHGGFDVDGDGEIDPFAEDPAGEDPVDSTTPELSDIQALGSDEAIPGSPLPDDDEFLEVLEGRIGYGSIILPLGTEASTPGDLNFGSADASGNFSVSATYDLSNDDIFFNHVTGYLDFTAEDIMPLPLREIVLHGMTLDAGDGANGGEADGTAGFKTVLPVASGEIRVIPTPTAAVMGLGLLGGLGLMKRPRRRRA